jgi:signal transduction histidine kinase/ActR/RegA family two-component response regulator
MLSAFKEIALGHDLVRNEAAEMDRSGLMVLNSVSFSLAAVSLLFLAAFHFNQSVSLTWFFFCEAVAFSLIPILARMGYENAAKFLLISYVDVGIVILSAVFGKDMFIQTFLIPACGLSVLLFGRRQLYLQNMGIGLTVLCYFVLDYIIFDQLYISDDETKIIKWSILSASFISTWMVFNKFSESKDFAEEETGKLLAQTQQLNKKLLLKQQELEETIIELKKAKEKVEQGSRAKTDFLSTVSHEIRTPMNAIIGMTNLLVKDNPRSDQLEQLEVLDFSAKTLLALINDVLDFSKIESGKIELERTAFNLRHLLTGVMESFRFTTEKKGIELMLKVEESIPEVLIADPARLTQILNNLVSNAVKFTNEGSVKVGVVSADRHVDQLVLRFCIEDTGIGISPDKLERVFESFTQERSDTTRIFGGTGLGLTICKKLVELQQGKIYVESTKGVGSTFYVELVFGVGENVDSDRIYPLITGSLSSLDGAKIMVVEDNILNQKVMSRFLERWNMNIVIANNGEEALHLLHKANVHLILMDLQMPVMDGYEAARSIRTLDDPLKRNVPIIALTAAALKEVKERVFASGMNDYITKPFNPVELQSKLKQYMLSHMNR